MFAKRYYVYLSIIAVLFLTACGSRDGQATPPELIAPVSNRIDMAVVSRGTLARVAQYEGIIRMDSEILNFGVTPLPFDGFHVMVGERVVEGQLLARLDMEDIEEERSNLLREISFVQGNHEFENEMKRNEISILRSQRNELLFADADRELVNVKTVEIDRKQLELEHGYEQQELFIRELEIQVENLDEQLVNGEILAPFDGIVTWLAPITFGESIYPFQTIVCISNGQDVFIEYASNEHIRFSADNPIIKALVGEELYDLRVRVLSDEERSRYAANNLNPPIRFEFVNSGHNLVPGAPVVIRHYVDVAYDTLKIPVNGLYTVSGETYVYVNNNGNREKRYVEVGIRNRAFVEILYGLVEGDEVFVR